MNTSSLEHTSPTAAPPRGPGGADPTRSLLDRLAVLRQTVTALVERRSADDPTANDPLRGLYLSEEAVRHLLRTRPAPVPEAAGRPAGPTGWPEDTDDRLAQVAVRLRLTELDTAVLLIALAPDLDRTFEPLYGYLNDDVSRRRATVGLALDLCGVPAHLPEARARFHLSAPLRALGLLTVEEADRPLLTRSLCVPDRLTAHLLGDDIPDAVLLGRLHPMPDALPAGAHDEAFVQRLATRARRRTVHRLPAGTPRGRRPGHRRVRSAHGGRRRAAFPRRPRNRPFTVGGTNSARTSVKGVMVTLPSGTATASGCSLGVTRTAYGLGPAVASGVRGGANVSSTVPVVPG